MLKCCLIDVARFDLKQLKDMFYIFTVYKEHVINNGFKLSITVACQRSCRTLFNSGALNVTPRDRESPGFVTNCMASLRRATSPREGSATTERPLTRSGVLHYYVGSVIGINYRFWNLP